MAKYHAACATDSLGDMVDPGTRRPFLVTAFAAGRGRVQGTDLYACGSNFARSVVHAGVLADGATGIVEVAATPERQRGGFLGSPRHGVSSENYTRSAYACAIRLLECISDAQ
ncbi:LCCL domain-containing protein [Dokdonella immobilis]|uniref:LCCL domain-containing protein n=1 Tax=Dokdonella immobilis TaxID=578942 RepID=A0A1I4X7C3_9GAMM|nr:LCCL domain-containing protein [Dokdonella immobilis]SFN21794.1 LCCL domain-containing protein [Dokdonella immobilis]